MLIERGRVTVNGRSASLGDRADVTDDVRVDGIPLPLDPEQVTWLVYKPRGVVTTMDDPQGRSTVRELVPPEPVTKPVGRLDLESEGLLLMSNDGRLAHVLTHPSYGVAKTYHVLVNGTVTKSELARLTEGVPLGDGVARARQVRVVARHGDQTIVEIVMGEGKKREIRRMMAAIGLDVVRLVRTAIGDLVDRTLSPGAYRRLEVAEIRSLYASAGHEVDP
ncbi:MAG: pseudouridine synthase [Acidimicrobiia bacterium]|nr:pseudouridine synthase [Acidimicrobiia bacterium]